MLSRRVLVLSLFRMLPNVSLAGIITFDGLTGNERDPFTTPYVEGTFQVTPSGSLEAHITVTGCFRVNVPAPESGVPVTVTPPSPLCP